VIQKAGWFGVESRIGFAQKVNEGAMTSSGGDFTRTVGIRRKWIEESYHGE
jgi:hypothetical protein